MGERSSIELALCLLLIVACGLEGQIGYHQHYIISKMTWTKARLYCQKYYAALVTWDMLNVKMPNRYLLQDKNVSHLWFGLLRDPEDDSVWKSINLRTGEGVSGDDLSQTSEWASGQNHCAFVGDDLMWYSAPCSNKINVYCSQGYAIQYYNVTLSWNEAVLYCKKHSSQLATVTQLNSAHTDKRGWIGLYRVGGEIWNWTGLPSSYRKWAPGQPLTADCSAINAFTSKWVGFPCSQQFNPLCFNDNLVVVKENKTWEDALMHCRAMDASCAGCKYDLLSLTQVSDYSYVRDRIYSATTDEVWIGLRFLGSEWIWLNGNKSNQQDGLPECPSHWNHCGTMSKYGTNSSWIIRDCAETRNFVCMSIKP